MFSWICPRCGRDNPPSASTCLSCGTRFDAEPETLAAEEQVRDPEAEAIPLTAPLEEPATAVKRELPARPVSTPNKNVSRFRIPTWLLAVVVFLTIYAVGSAGFYAYEYLVNRKQATSTGLDPAANVARTKLSNPLQKVVEVVGIRLVQDAKRKPQARFVVVNHSPNALDELSATVTLWASTSRSEEDSVGTFTFKIPSLGAYNSKEISAPLNTKLKFYELPDWQNATPDVQITSP